MKLNDQQHKIVNTPSGKIAVIAGAGAGKTTTTLELIEKQYLENNVSLEKMFISTFTNKAAKDIKERLQKKLKLNDAFFNRLWLGTFHSLGYRYLTQIKNLKLNIILPVEANHYLKNIYKQVTRNDSHNDDSETSFSDIVQSIERKRNQNCPWENVTKFPDICAEILRVYQKEKREQNIVDYTDILDMFAEHLKTDTYFRSKFEWVFVDECQDNNFQQHILADLLTNKNSAIVGDEKQCWEENELMPVFLGGKTIEMLAKDLKIGDKLKSLRGHKGLDFFPITNISKFSEYSSICVHTKSGKKIEVSEDHLFLSKFQSESKFHVYLMYHKDFGFRIGSSCLEFGQRARHEHTNRMWLLKECSSLDESLYYESYLSLKYQIPRSLYKVGTRDLKTSDESLKKIFIEFGFKNSPLLFEDFKLDFEFPHYISLQNTNNFLRVKLVRTSVRTNDRYEVQVDSSLPELDLISKKFEISLRKFFSVYKEAFVYAKDLHRILSQNLKIDVILVESLYFDKKLFVLHKAKSLKKGSILLVENKGVVSYEEIEKIETLYGKKTFVSIEVAKTGLAINSSGVISHNSIYAWRGALPQMFKDKVKKADYVYPLSYNYRSTKEIIDFANVLLKQIPSFGGQELISTKNSGLKPTYTVCENLARQIHWAIKDDIKRGVPLHEIAVLGRSIKPVNIQALTVYLRQDNIPYCIRGGDDKLNASYIQNYLSTLKSICSPTKVSLINTLSLLPGVGAKTAMALAESVVANGFESIRDGAKYTGTKAFKDYLNLVDYKNIKKEFLLKTLDFIHEHYLVPNYSKKDKNEPDNKKKLIYDVLFNYLMGFHKIVDGIDSLYVNEEDAESDKDKIVISTIHQSKGLEWDSVHIANMNEFSIPYLTEKDEGDIDREEEEFCLVYVACTRAKKSLKMYMPYTSGAGSWSKVNKLSRYIVKLFQTTEERYFTLRFLDVGNELEFKQRILTSAVQKANC